MRVDDLTIGKDDLTIGKLGGFLVRARDYGARWDLHPDDGTFDRWGLAKHRELTIEAAATLLEMDVGALAVWAT
jgi:hypothetical protein